MQCRLSNQPVQEMRFRTERFSPIHDRDGQLLKFVFSGLYGHEKVSLKVTTVSKDLYIIPYKLESKNKHQIHIPNNAYLEFYLDKPVDTDSLEFKLDVKFKAIVHRDTKKLIRFFKERYIDPCNQRFDIYNEESLTRIKRQIDFNRIRLCIWAQSLSLMNGSPSKELSPAYTTDIIKNSGPNPRQ